MSDVERLWAQQAAVFGGPASDSTIGRTLSAVDDDSIAGSHQPQWLDVLHRAHAGVEDRVRTNKAMGLRNLPSKSWQTNCGWILACNLAADLDAWTRLLALHDLGDLADAEPDTLRYRLWHLPAKLTSHARRRWLNISHDWPWREAFLTCWDRLTALPPAPA